MRQRRRKEKLWVRSCSIFLASDKEITVCGCEKVEKYCPDEVILKLSDIRVVIKGKEMSFSVCYGSEIRLAGKIEELKMIGENEEKERGYERSNRIS